MDDSSTRIRKLLVSLRKTSATGKHFFIYDDLRSHITKELVFDALSNSIPLYRRLQIIEDVMERGLRLFCILVWIQQEKYLISFLEHSTLDSRLPIAQESEIKRIEPALDLKVYTETQWEFFPWHLGRGLTHAIVPDAAVLPFLGEKTIAEGAGGMISKIEVPSTLQDFLECKSESTVIVVRKLIKQKRKAENTNRAFQEEKHFLSLYHALQHPNIIQLLGSFTFQGTHNLLFPFFTMDIAQFFAQKTRYGEFHQSITFYAALSGLASALDAVHNLRIRSRLSPEVITSFGYHHDIRPANILVTPTTFILTDFGLARSEPFEKSSPSLWNPNRGDYIAPECMNEEMSHQTVGRSYDIWSFGCFVAEMVTYMEMGPNGLAEFRAKRHSHRYYQENYINYFFFGDHSLKAGVSEWLTRVSYEAKDRVSKSLIEVSTSMLRIDISERPCALVTSSRLEYLRAKRLFWDASELFSSIISGIMDYKNEASTHTILELKIELSKLRSFGVVLGMEDDTSINCQLFKDSSFVLLAQQNLKNVSESLRRFKQITNQDNNMRTINVVGNRVVADCFPRRFIDEQLPRAIKLLCEAVPNSYQQYLTQLSLSYILDSTQSEVLLHQVEDFTKESPGQYHNLGAHAAMKRIELSLWQEVATLDIDEQGLILDISQVKIIRNFSRNHQLGLFTRATERTAVLVEWVLFSKFEDSQSDDERIGKILIFAGLLQAPKPTTFHVLDCLGFIPPSIDSGHQGFGFVYAFPSHAQNFGTQEPITLRQLLASDSNFSITLESKFEMAKSLTSTIYELHCHRWLHKNLHSENVIFFMDDPSAISRDKDGLRSIATPYLIGFYHSRPDNQVFYSNSNDATYDSTSALYQHPEYKHNLTRFQKKYDYYSVGILLLEMAFWKPIQVIRAKCDKERVLNDEGFQKKLIRKYVPLLGEIMGSAYQAAVLSCLTSSFDTTQMNLDAEDDLGRFYWAVVARLAICRVI